MNSCSSCHAARRCAGTMITLAGFALAMFSALMLTGCSKASSGGGGASGSAQSHEGQGTEVSADPEFVLSMKIGDQALKAPLRQLSIYESKPAKEGKPAPQGFELDGENVMLAGRLPEGLNVAPSQKFQQL